MLSEDKTTKHASNGPVMLVAHRCFAVFFILPSCCVNRSHFLRAGVNRLISETNGMHETSYSPDVRDTLHYSWANGDYVYSEFNQVILPIVFHFRSRGSYFSPLLLASLRLIPPMAYITWFTVAGLLGETLWLWIWDRRFGRRRHPAASSNRSLLNETQKQIRNYHNYAERSSVAERSERRLGFESFSDDYM